MSITSITLLSSILVALITSVLGPVLLVWVRSKFDKTKKIDTLGEAFKVNEEVDHQLDIMMDKLKCDRIWIAQFHNGGYFYPTGKSIQKFSIFYEKISPLIVPVINIFQNIPTSLFPKTLVKLHNDGELIIHDNEISNYQDISYLFDNCKAKSLYMIAIEDLEGHFIGMISVSYENNKHTLNQEEWIFLRQKIGAIGSILTNYLNPKTT
jgi:hypothetical protein